MLLALIFAIGQGVTVWAVLRFARKLGEYTESNILLHDAIVKGFAEVARIRRADRDAHTQPNPAAHICEEESA